MSLNEVTVKIGSWINSHTDKKTSNIFGMSSDGKTIFIEVLHKNESLYHRRETRIKSEYINVLNYSLSPVKHSYCDFELIVSSEFIYDSDDNFDHSWGDSYCIYDIEVYTPFNDFTNARRIQDKITAISMLTCDKYGTKNLYLLLNNWAAFKRVRQKPIFSKEKIDITIINTRAMNGNASAMNGDYVNGKESENEHEINILNKFFAILAEKRFRALIDYNGSSYDIPYIIKRMEILELPLPNISQLINIDNTTIDKVISSPFGLEQVTDFNTPGMVHIDLIYYYRLYYPGLSNYRLDTVSKLIVGMGKTGMSIPTFYKALNEGNPDLLREAAEYSLRDVVVLFDMWNLYDGPKENLFKICGQLSTEVETFLSTDLINSVTDLVFSVSSMNNIKVNNKMIDKKIELIKPSLYKDVYVYNIVNQFLEITKDYYKYDVNKLMILNHVYDSPISFTLRLITSKYIISEELMELLRNYVISASESDSLILYKDGLIYSTEELDLNYVTFIESLLLVTKDSRIEFKDGEVNFFGSSFITKPKIPFIKKYLEDVVKKGGVVAIPNYKKDLKSLVIEEWVKPNIDDVNGKSIRAVETKANEIKKQLNKQINIGRDLTQILEKTKVKYVMTKDGPLIIDDETDLKTLNIDFDYYDRVIKRVIKEIS